MKLITHNLLTSRMISKVQSGYPLKLTASEVTLKESEFSATFTAKLLSRVCWDVLCNTVNNIGYAENADLPLEVPEDFERNDDFLRKAHHALVEIDVITGELECPETGRKFQIQNGVPNMLVNEDEV